VTNEGTWYTIDGSTHAGVVSGATLRLEVWKAATNQWAYRCYVGSALVATSDTYARTWYSGGQPGICALWDTVGYKTPVIGIDWMGGPLLLDVPTVSVSEVPATLLPSIYDETTAAEDVAVSLTTLVPSITDSCTAADVPFPYRSISIADAVAAWDGFDRASIGAAWTQVREAVITFSRSPNGERYGFRSSASTETCWYNTSAGTSDAQFAEVVLDYVDVGGTFIGGNYAGAACHALAGTGYFNFYGDPKTDYWHLAWVSSSGVWNLIAESDTTPIDNGDKLRLEVWKTATTSQWAIRAYVNTTLVYSSDTYSRTWYSGSPGLCCYASSAVGQRHSNIGTEWQGGPLLLDVPTVEVSAVGEAPAPNISDSSTPAEDLAVSVNPLVPSVEDSSTAADVPTVETIGAALITIPDAYDSITATEDVTVSVGVAASVSDSTTAAEDVTVLLPVLVASVVEFSPSCAFDFFDRADGVLSDDVAWATPYWADEGLVISNGVVRKTNPSTAEWDAGTYGFCPLSSGHGQWAEFRYLSGAYVGIILRFKGIEGTFLVSWHDAAFHLSKYISGAWSHDIDDAVAGTLTPGDRFRAEIYHTSNPRLFIVRVNGGEVARFEYSGTPWVWTDEQNGIALYSGDDPSVDEFTTGCVNIPEDYPIDLIQEWETGSGVTSGVVLSGVSIVSDESVAEETVTVHLHRLFVEVSDECAATEWAQPNFGAPVVQVSDSTTAAESLSLGPHRLFVDLSDQSSAAEDLSVSVHRLFIDLAESSTPAEDVQAGQRSDLWPMVSDQTEATEAAAALPHCLFIGASDSSDIDELVLVGFGAPVLSLEDIQTSQEQVTVSLHRLFVSLSDESLASEIISASLRPLRPSVSDSSAVAEDLQCATIVALSPDVSDSSTVSEAATPLLPQLRPGIYDASSAEESISASLHRLFILASDDESVAEWISTVVRLSCSVSDSTTGADAASILVSALKASTFDTQATEEDLEAILTAIKFGVYEECTPLDVVMTQGSVNFCSVYDSVTVAEFLRMHWRVPSMSAARRKSGIDTHRERTVDVRRRIDVIAEREMEVDSE